RNSSIRKLATHHLVRTNRRMALHRNTIIRHRVDFKHDRLRRLLKPTQPNPSTPATERDFLCHFAGYLPVDNPLFGSTKNLWITHPISTPFKLWKTPLNRTIRGMNFQRVSQNCAIIVVVEKTALTRCGNTKHQGLATSLDSH